MSPAFENLLAIATLILASLFVGILIVGAFMGVLAKSDYVAEKLVLIASGCGILAMVAHILPLFF